MAVSESKYRKSKKALEFLTSNADEAKEELGEEGYAKYTKAFEGVIGKYEAGKAQDIIKTHGGTPITEGYQEGARKERDLAVQSPSPKVAPLTSMGQPLRAGKGMVSGAAESVKPKTGEAAVKSMVSEATSGPASLESAEGAAVPLSELIKERENIEKVKQQQYDESLPNASKLKELNTPPEYIGEGPVNHQSMWFEPTVEEFHREMRDVLGDQVKQYGEDTDTYKEYADQKWKEAYDEAKKNNRTLMRVDYSPSTTGGPFEWKNRLAHAQDVLYAGVAGVDKGLLLGAGKALSEAVTPGAGAKIEQTQERHPVASGVGIAGGLMSPGAVANVAARGASSLGRALAPGTARLLTRSPILGGIVSGAAQGAVGAGTQVAGEELVSQAAGAAPPDLPGALRRGGEAAGVGAVLGGGLGGAIGGAARLQEKIRQGKLGTDLRRFEAPEVGGRTTILSGVRAGEPVRNLRARAVKAGRPVEEGGGGVYPAPSPESQLASEVSEDVRRFGAEKTAEYQQAEEGLTGDIRGLAERRFRDYETQLEKAAGEVTGYAQERTRRHAIREAEAGQFAGDYARRSLNELESTEQGLVGELVDYGTEASREYDGLLDSLTQTTLKGARKFTEEQKREAGEIVGKYYRSTEGKRTRDTKPIIKAFDDSLRKMTDDRGYPLVNRERATQDVQSQARLLFNEKSIRIADSPQEADALARKISADNAKRQRGQFGEAEVLTIPQARRLGLQFDEAANIADEKAARVVVERRRLDAKGMDAYLYGYRDWANANSTKGIKYRETAGVERSIHRAREQSPGFSDVKEQAAELASTAERRQKAVGIRGERVGREDIDTEKAVRGVVEGAREGVAPNPELENILVREGATAPMHRVKRLKKESADIGLDLPRPEGVSQQETEALRGKVRKGLTLENPSLENILARRGRLRDFRRLQSGREQMKRLGVSEDIRDADISGRKLVEGYAKGEPNPQLEGIAHQEGWLQALREIPAIREEMAVLGMKPNVGDIPDAAFEKHVRSVLEQFADNSLPPPTAKQLRAILGTRGFNNALLPLMKENFAILGIPEKVGEKFTPSQAAAVKQILQRYSEGTLPEAQREALTTGLWMSRPGAPADLDRLPRLKKELAAVGLKPEVGQELTPEQITKVKGILQRYAAGEANPQLEKAVGPGLPKLRLLPGLRSTERLEEAAKPALRASQSSLWASIPTLSPLILRGDAALRNLRKLRPSSAGAGNEARKRKPTGGGARLSEEGKEKLRRLRSKLDPGLRRL